MQKTKTPGIVVILVFTLITIILWASLDIYRGITKKPTTVIDEKLLTPLNPNLYQEALKRLQSRIYISDNE